MTNSIAQIHLDDNEIGTLLFVACGDQEAIAMCDVESISTLSDRNLIIADELNPTKLFLSKAGRELIPALALHQAE